MRQLEPATTCAVNAAAFLALSALATPAFACVQIAPPPELRGTPQDGATNVPIDVVPLYFVPRGDVNTLRGDSWGEVPGEFTLVSSTGAVVSIVERAIGNQSFELVPASPLSANTQYVLTGRWSEADAVQGEARLTFTTGSDLAAPPDPPTAVIRHFHRNGALTSCDDESYGSCVSVGSAGYVQARPRDSFGRLHEPYISEKHVGINLSGHEQGTDLDCLELRTRAANGLLSEPTMVCRDDGQLVEIDVKEDRCLDVPVATALGALDGTAAKESAADEDTMEMEQDEEPDEAHAGGCRVTAQDNAELPAFALLLSVLGFAMRRRRRASSERRLATKKAT